jgi:hypothetical protein
MTALPPELAAFASVVDAQPGHVCPAKSTSAHRWESGTVLRDAPPTGGAFRLWQALLAARSLDENLDRRPDRVIVEAG